MSVKNRITAVLALCAIVLSLGACAVKLDPPAEMSSEDEALNMGFAAVEYNSKIEVGGYQYLDVEIKLNYEKEVRWSSDNPEVAKVDSNGRVDGLKVGKCVITAKAKSATIDYEIQVVKAKETEQSYSTAITANDRFVKGNTASANDKSLYGMVIDLYSNSATAFTYDSEGKYNKPVRAMLCSTGKDGATPVMETTTGEKSEWVEGDNKYYRYATALGDDIMLCSTAYSAESPDALLYEEFNRLGSHTKDSNVYFALSDAKWIYENLTEGSKIRIIDPEPEYSSRYSPLGVPEKLTITDASVSKNWDPTGDDENNPYAKMLPEFSGVDDIYIEAQTGFDPLAGVFAIDICGNDITSRVMVDGDFDRNRLGSYIVSYYATDSLGRIKRHDRQITVVRDLSEITTQSATE